VLDCDQQQAEAYFAQLEEPHFYNVQTLALFRALTKIEVDGGRFDPVALTEQLKLDGQLVNVGGIEAIAALNVPSSADFSSYLAILNDRRARREAIRTAEDSLRQARNLSAPFAAQPAKVALQDKLAARMFSAATKPVEPTQCYVLAGVGISTSGNLATLAAQAKQGKTAIIGAAIASTFAEPGSDCLSITSTNEKGLAVVHLDTEQSPFDHWTLVDRAIRRAGAGATPAWLNSYCGTGLSLVELRQAIRLSLDRAAQKFGGIHSFILDGAADCVADVNDPAESNDFVAELHALAIQYNCPIIGVIHLNPGSEFKTRGHLGSQLERKAETNLRLEKDADGVSVLWADKNRRAPILKKSGPRFAWSNEHNMHVSVTANGQPEHIVAAEMTRERLQEAFRIAGKPALYWADLVTALQGVPGVNSKRTAERTFTDARKLFLIRKTVLRQYELA
jgi:hypothetical protein